MEHFHLTLSLSVLTSCAREKQNMKESIDEAKNCILCVAKKKGKREKASTSLLCHRNDSFECFHLFLPPNNVCVCNFECNIPKGTRKSAIKPFHTEGIVILFVRVLLLRLWICFFSAENSILIK
jgi:hypothetical protein